eukprot:Tbor_TRINITY_DN668_c0_g1::TRINITY_DN668_c0_g1_i1::g.1599::m.1599
MKQLSSCNVRKVFYRFSPILINMRRSSFTPGENGVVTTQTTKVSLKTRPDGSHQLSDISGRSNNNNTTSHNSVISSFSSPTSLTSSSVTEEDQATSVDTVTTTSEVTDNNKLGGALYGTSGGGLEMDHGPLRATGLWTVDEVMDNENKTVDFRRIDDVESDIMEDIEARDDAVVLFAEEEKWKHKLMFNYQVKKTPKHLTWKELGQEIECMDCVFELDKHRPEEKFNISFYFMDKKNGIRDRVWSADNDISYSEGFTDLMAAVGSCLGRADVFRTVRFDNGNGTTRDITIRKKSQFTSEILMSFRPEQKYDVYDRQKEQDDYEKAMVEEGGSHWGFHPQLMDPEYRDKDDPVGTYTISLSAHSLSCIMLRGIERLIEKPMHEFYRPSQVARTSKVAKSEEIGLGHAMKGWLGIETQIYPHYTSIEALQEHWLGADAPFSLVAIVNKMREMTYLKKKNPEFQSWLSVRRYDTALAIRNVSVKMLGAGASTLFVPRTHNATVNQLLPKCDRRRLESRVSINALLGMPDETRKIADFKKITSNYKLTDTKTSSEGVMGDSSNRSNNSSNDSSLGNNKGDATAAEDNTKESRVKVV